MEKSTRRWLAIGLAVCGLSAAISLAIAIYASANTPEIQEVVITATNGGQSSQSKTSFLFEPAAYQIFLFLMLLNPLIRWKRIVQKQMEKAAPKDLWTEPTVGRYRFSTVVIAITAAVCTTSIMSLYWAVEKADYLLRK